MLRSCLKTIFYVVQLTVCFILILEKTQPSRFPAPYPSGRLPAKYLSLRLSSYRQPRHRTNQPPQQRIFSWRRLLFLLS
jgi:hypothetical protein